MSGRRWPKGQEVGRGLRKAPEPVVVRDFAAEARPAPPGFNSQEVWYRGWECGYDAEAGNWLGEPWRAYKGGCDLGARQASARSWEGLLDEIDAEEDEQ